MEKWEEVTEEFDVVSRDGRVFHVLVYTEFSKPKTFQDRNAPPVEGLKTARTSEGYHVNRIDEEDWEIVDLQLRGKRKAS